METQPTKICPKCEKERRLTQFSLLQHNERKEICRFCLHSGTTADEKHKILKEAYRNYLTYKQFVADTGQDVIEYAIPESKGSDKYVNISISFSDLERALKTFTKKNKKRGTVLSERKEQAFHLHIIRDMKQKDVMEIMGITTVSVGQYVDSSMRQLAKYYFAEDEDVEDDEDDGT